jgi:ATP-dependent Clp protease protease subunit
MAKSRGKIRTAAQVPEYMKANASPPLKTTYIRFFGQVNADTTARLLKAVDEGIGNGTKRFHILISSPGGSVFHGLSIYNYLKGIPAEVVTHNFGSVDSIGVVIYAAGSRRLSVPHARFLLHGVQSQFPAGAALKEPQLEERLKSMRIDIENIAGVISSTVSKPESEVAQMMIERTTLSPEEALQFGLVHEIEEQLIPDGASLVTIEQTASQAQGGQNLPSQIRTLLSPPPGVRAEALN